MRPAKKALVGLLGIALILGLVLGASGRAAATQNAPSWAVGDLWSYSSSGGTITNWTIVEQTSLTVGGNTYQVWHFQVTSPGSRIVTDYWYTSDFRVVKVNLAAPVVGNVTTVFNPPEPRLVFPLNPGNSWTGTSDTSVTTVIGTFPGTSSYSGTVTGESSVTVPAGTFTAAAVRSPSAGNPYTVSYYSDAVGFFVQIRNFNGQGNPTTTVALTGYRYSGNGLLLFLVVIVVLVVIAAVGVLYLRRRRPRMPYPMQPQPPGPPSYLPPPQGPPGGGNPPPPGS